MVLAGAVAGTVTAAATAVGAAGTLNGNLISYQSQQYVHMIITKTNNWERTFLQAQHILLAVVTDIQIINVIFYLQVH